MLNCVRGMRARTRFATRLRRIGADLLNPPNVQLSALSPDCGGSDEGRGSVWARRFQDSVPLPMSATQLPRDAGALQSQRLKVFC